MTEATKIIRHRRRRDYRLDLERKRRNDDGLADRQGQSFGHAPWSRAHRPSFAPPH